VGTAGDQEQTVGSAFLARLREDVRREVAREEFWAAAELFLARADAGRMVEGAVRGREASRRRARRCGEDVPARERASVGAIDAEPRPRQLGLVATAQRNIVALSMRLSVFARSLRIGCDGTALQARDAASQLGEHVLGLEAELLEQARVALGIDLLGQLLIGLVNLVGLAMLTEHVEDLVLGDLHGGSFRCWGCWSA
jgi:hypothetical protein